MVSQDYKKYKIPDNPGVYFFQKGKSVLYVGRATSLKDRVKSYFSKDLIVTRGPLLVDMLFNADNLKWQETDSVLEAVLLEAHLIKTLQPKYNTKEKDQKSFYSVVITDEDFPKILIERSRNLKILKYKTKAIYGPFTNSGQLKEALKIIRKIFPFRDNHSSKKDNYEFYRQIELTPDTSNEIAKREYNKNIKNIELLFEGQKQRIVKNLEKEMLKFAKEKKFEQAGEVKRKIYALNHIRDIALIKKDVEGGPAYRQAGQTTPNSEFRIEAYDIAHMSGKNMVGVITVVSNGVAQKSEYRKFNVKSVSGANDTGALKEIMQRRLNHAEWPLPNLIVVDGGDAQLNVATKALVDTGHNIPVVAVVKDERHKADHFLGDKNIISKMKDAIILSNLEAHRFAITFHREKRGKKFL